MLKMKQDTPVRLPNEYQEVEYIESTGTQYIDTGVAPTNKTNIKLDIEFISGESDKWIPLIAERTKVSDYSGFSAMFGIWINSNTKEIALNYVDTDTAGITGTNGDGRHIYSNTENKFYLDNTLIKTLSTSSFTSTINLYVFALNESIVSSTNIETRNCTAKLYELKIYDDNILIRDFVPCYRKSDNEIGLYDLVNNVFYTNAGTGVFTMGAIIGSEDINLNPVLNNKKIMKIYKGNTLKYYRRIQFYKCPFPTSWTKSETSQTGYPPIYISTNDYGQWTIESSAVASGVGNPDVHYAFDNDKNTHFMSSGLAESNSIAYIEIDSPIDICPRVFYIIVEKINGFTIQGFNENNEWEDITSISGQIGNKTEKTVEVQTSKYYTKFKVNMKRYSSSKKYPYVYEFQIISGTFKK